MDNLDYAEGDIVQVVDESDSWFGVLLVVTEAKPHRLMAFASWPQSNAEHDVANAYRFLDPAKVARVGRIALALA